MPQPTGWGSYAVNLQESDPDSFLSLYRQALGVRHSSTLFGHGSAAVTHTDQVLTVHLWDAAGRTGRIVVNMDPGSGATVPTGRVVLASGVNVAAHGRLLQLGPLTAAWVSER